MSHIFISYSRKNIRFAKNSVKALQKDFEVWFDKNNIRAGMKWSEEIENAIETCFAFVLIMSPDSKESDWVEKELLHAQDNNRTIIPILLDGQAFFALKNVQYIDMQGQTGKKIPDELKTALETAYRYYLDSASKDKDNVDIPDSSPPEAQSGLVSNLFGVAILIAVVVMILAFVLQFVVSSFQAEPTETVSITTPGVTITLTAAPSDTALPTSTPVASITPSVALDIPLNEVVFETWADESGLLLDERLKAVATQHASYLARLPFQQLDDEDSDWCLHDDLSGIIQNIRELTNRNDVMMFIAIDRTRESAMSLYDLVSGLPHNIQFGHFGYAEIVTLRQFVVLVVQSPDDISDLPICYIVESD